MPQYNKSEIGAVAKEYGFAKSQFSDSEEFVAAYAWIAEKMKERVGPAPASVQVPIWAWYRRHA